MAQTAAGDVLVFCEVKTRTTGQFGSLFEAVTPAKQRRLRRLATRWLRHADRQGRRDGQIRFAFTTGSGGSLAVEVLEDAF